MAEKRKVDFESHFDGENKSQAEPDDNFDKKGKKSGKKHKSGGSFEKNGKDGANKKKKFKKNSNKN
jgi:hypothetical protein